jgi:hypothetical protein
MIWICFKCSSDNFVFNHLHSIAGHFLHCIASDGSLGMVFLRFIFVHFFHLFRLPQFLFFFFFFFFWLLCPLCSDYNCFYCSRACMEDGKIPGVLGWRLYILFAKPFLLPFWHWLESPSFILPSHWHSHSSPHELDSFSFLH